MTYARFDSKGKLWFELKSSFLYNILKVSILNFL